MERQPRLVRDVWHTILDDQWMWMVIWGKQRRGKTTCALQLAYAVYGDWDKVLQCFVFTLPGLLYKMKKGTPERVWTRNQLHNRVPMIIYDDWGGSANKAMTQHDKAWDVFKGAFDLFGTKLAVLVATMVDPREPTQQLMDKYTHEVWIPFRGVYKYDEVDWRQDYWGWKPTTKKDWIESQDFYQVPADVYKEYDEMRMSLVDEAVQRITDAMVESIGFTLNRLLPLDVKLLYIIEKRGPIFHRKVKEELGEEEGKETLVRCKARNLVVPIRKSGTYYKYDLTDFGREVLRALESKEMAQTPV